MLLLKYGEKGYSFHGYIFKIKSSKLHSIIMDLKQIQYQ